MVCVIYVLYEQCVVVELLWGYFGWFELGELCECWFWYGFCQVDCEVIGGQFVCLFNIGYCEEDWLLNELCVFGYEVFDWDLVIGQQFVMLLYGGYFSGYLDVVVCGLFEVLKIWYLVDVKIIKMKKFDELLKKGLCVMYFKYYVQGQGYMGYQGFECVVFIFVCKDDDCIYVECFEFDVVEFKKFEQKVLCIIDVSELLLCLFEDLVWFECKFCYFYGLCYGLVLLEVNCWICVYLMLCIDFQGGVWVCECGVVKIQYLCVVYDCYCFILVLLVNVVEFVDSDGDSVIYCMLVGVMFSNGLWFGFVSVEIVVGGIVVVIDLIVCMLCEQFFVVCVEVV